MKTRITALMLALTLCLILAASVTASAAEHPGRPILVASYINYAWGFRYEAGFVDENGVCWTLSLSGDDSGGHPSGDRLHTAYPASAYTQTGKLKSDVLFTLKGMVLGAEDRKPEYQPVACDAGSYSVSAIRYGKDGEAKITVLGAAGDDLYENTDPTAQALYRKMTELFPAVPHFADDPSVSPMGFIPNGVLDFLGIGCGDPALLTASACLTDCEAGPEEAEPSFTVQELMDMQVTGKANCESVTGGTEIITLRNAAGEYVGSVEFCRGLLVTSDGMYYVK